MGLNHWIVDNTVISNFAMICKLDLLKEKLANILCITEEVKREFLIGIDKGIIPETDISWLTIVNLTEEEEELFAKLCSRLGKGESSCLSIAVSRKWKLFTDDIDARNVAQRFEVPISGTIGLLTYLIHKRDITLAAGNKMLGYMITKGYYSPVKKLDDLLYE